MKSKEIVKPDPQIKAELPALREFNTYNEALDITEEEIAKLSNKERRALLDSCNILKKKAEKEGWLPLSRANSFKNLLANKPTVFGRISGHISDTWKALGG